MAIGDYEDQFQVEDWTLKVTLTDFGLAKVMSNICQAGTKTTLAGSPGYQPPEQLRAEKIGIHCDIYAVGGVILVTFGGKPMWPGLSPFQIMCKITVENKVPDTSHLQIGLGNLCQEFSPVNCRPNINYIFKKFMSVV